MDRPDDEFTRAYSDERFREKLLRYARAAGSEVVERALWLYYAAEDPKTPTWARGAIYAALGYFIFPVDAIPDAVPAAGYADDLGVLAAAVAAVAISITPRVKEQAREKMRDWFGLEKPQKGETAKG
jgi:uncharacterized membrane protein YkvA (DUF1232 family)